jgi:hypothetical protein
VDGLREQDDMLANTNALGQPVACMRFMGGREFGELAGALRVPCFAATGVPFAGRCESGRDGSTAQLLVIGWLSFRRRITAVRLQQAVVVQPVTPKQTFTLETRTHSV